MKMMRPFVAVIMMMLGSLAAMAQSVDSVDVTDYDLAFDLSNGAPFTGKAVITMQLSRPCSTIGLDLIGTVDSIRVSGRDTLSYDIHRIALPAVGVGESFTVTVYYRGNGYVESQGWGGFHFDNDMSYNLGVAFNDNPHVLGRAMFPCRDNFTDKATYTFRMKTRSGWTAECGGVCQSRSVDSTGCEHSVWRIDQSTPTYLASVSQAAWRRMERDIHSSGGIYPLTVGFLNQDSNNVVSAFAELDSVVPQYERCFGPYRWGRIGYIATRQGSMESVNNIALYREFVSSMDERAQSTIAHELGHAWFGNLVTCSTAGDMWFNEGGASFCSEVAMESVLGRKASNDYYQRNLESVIRETHITDGGVYRPLSGMPHAYTYGSTTYDKGWMMWHYLRGYLGEEVFYNAMTRLMQSKAFGNVDAYAVRDSLSLYSGVDLTDFFDFHVFNPGFVDYHVEMVRGGCIENEVAVIIKQQGVGTSARMGSNRVPVTFFAGDGWDSTSCKRWIEFDGEECQEMVYLPFVPDFCVLDLDREISDAATNAEITFMGVGQRGAEVAHMRIKATERQNDSVTLYIEHHWGKPYDIDTMAGVSSSINRYWVVNAEGPMMHGVQGMFRFVRGNFPSGNYPYLDNNRLPSSSFDSAAVLYRPSANYPWTVVSRTTLDNNYESFFVVNNLQPGEYTIAIVDTALVSIFEAADGRSVQLFPNPLRRGEPLSVDVPVDAPFRVTVYDGAGRVVWQRDGVVSRQHLNPCLAPGAYTVHVDNENISLQSRLIQL